MANTQKELLDLQKQYQTLNQKKNATHPTAQTLDPKTKAALEQQSKAKGYSTGDDVFSKLSQLPGLDKNPKLQKLALLQQQKHEMMIRKQAKPMGFASLMSDITL